MDAEEKVREARLRRQLARRGFTLSRSRRRDTGATDYGSYAITNASDVAVFHTRDLGRAEQWVEDYDSWPDSEVAPVSASQMRIHVVTLAGLLDGMRNSYPEFAPGGAFRDYWQQLQDATGELAGLLPENAEMPR